MRILVFGGTTEGREAAELLRRNGADFILSVATDYGRSVMDGSGIRVISGRLDAHEMKELMLREKIGVVIDATHPYAVEAGKNIRKACEEAGTEYIRIMRESGPETDGYYVDSAEEAVEYVSGLEGNIFISTGAKEIGAFSCVEPERLCVRVLPIDENIEKIRAIGISNIIAVRGPFTEEQNLEMMRGYDILVTKESGKNGGFAEKISAAKKLGMKIVIIKRPECENGIIIEELERNYDLYIGSGSGAQRPYDG